MNPPRTPNRVARPWPRSWPITAGLVVAAIVSLLLYALTEAREATAADSARYRAEHTPVTTAPPQAHTVAFVVLGGGVTQYRYVGMRAGEMRYAPAGPVEYPDPLMAMITITAGESGELAGCVIMVDGAVMDQQQAHAGHAATCVWWAPAAGAP